jgi:DNA-binding transcriptional MerR regulator
MSSLAKLHKIGAFAKMAATNLRTLRYYEEVGLLQPAARSSGGFRYYRESDLNRVKLISKLQELGLTLQEIRGVLEQRRDEGDRIGLFARVNAALTTHSGLIKERLKLIEAQQESISLAREKLEQCNHCQSIPSRENNYCEPCGLDGEQLPELLSGLF